MLSLEWIDDSRALDLIGGRGSWRQYPAYGHEAAARVGAASRALAFLRAGTPVAIANLRTRRVPLLGASTLVSHGPVLLGSPDDHGADLAACLAALRGAAGRLGLGEIRLDAEIGHALRGLDAAGAAQGWRADAAALPYRTMALDLSGGAEAVRRGFDGKWRRDLQRGEREGLDVRRSADPADFLRMEPLLADLSAAKGFGVAQDCAFFARCAASARGAERFFVHLVSRDGVLLSGHIGAFSGDTAVYLLGATTPAGREARASYVAQWAVIETALELGLAWYDLGGIDPDENPDVHRFKRRMGGRDVANGGTLVLPAPGLRGAGLALARRLYQKWRR